jgi:hypothetical protein
LPELNPLPTIKQRPWIAVVIAAIAVVVAFIYERSSGGKVTGWLRKVPVVKDRV